LAQAVLALIVGDKKLRDNKFLFDFRDKL